MAILIRRSSSPSGLLFPSNVSGSDQGAPYVALEFTNLTGLPIWGPANAGVTLIWERNVIQQTGYYVTFWYSTTPSFSIADTEPYYGCHPYPKNGTNADNTHDWELAGMEGGADWRATRAGGNKTVVYDTFFTQGCRITHNGGTKTGVFYTELPSVANADVIDHTSTSGYGNSGPSNAKLTIGDSPWFADFQHERFSGVLKRIKIIAKVLSESDMLSEAANMSQLVTADGIANIWWGKTGYSSVDDLTCSYGTGRAPSWATATKATLWTG